jgi:hypothetical protein
MDTIDLCHEQAGDCLRQADIDTNESDKSLWVTLAQSWLQLAQDIDRFARDNDARLERAVEDALN